MFPSRFRAISDSGSRLRVPTQRCRQYLCAKGVSVDIPECSSETGVGPCRTCRFLFLLPVRRPPSCPCCVAESWRSWCASTRRGLAWTPGLVGAGNHNHDYARPTSNRLPWHARWTGSEALRARERIDGRPRHQRFVSIRLAQVRWPAVEHYVGLDRCWSPMDVTQGSEDELFDPDEKRRRVLQSRLPRRRHPSRAHRVARPVPG